MKLRREELNRLCGTEGSQEEEEEHPELEEETGQWQKKEEEDTLELAETQANLDLVLDFVILGKNIISFSTDT